MSFLAGDFHRVRTQLSALTIAAGHHRHQLLRNVFLENLFLVRENHGAVKRHYQFGVAFIAGQFRQCQICFHNSISARGVALF